MQRSQEKITIGINGTVLKNPVSGVGKRLIHLILNLKKTNPSIQFFIFSPYPFFISELKNIPQVITQSILGEWVWLNFILPFQLKKYQVSFFDSIWGGGLPINSPFPKACPYAVTYHDFIELDKIKNAKKKTFFSSLILFFIKRKITKHLLLADKIIFVSNQVFENYQAHFQDLNQKIKKKIASKIVISWNGIYSRKNKTKKKVKNFILNKGIKKYFLYVGGFNPRKNVKSLILAYKLYQNKHLNQSSCPLLVLIGDKNQYFQKKIQPLIKRNNSIFRLGYLAEDQLDFFYCKAKLFFYPSLQEGFGMPPLEALAQGTEVVVDHKLPLNEFKLSGVHSIDMRNPNEIIKMMNKNKKTPPELTQLKKFQWNKIAKKYYQQVYQSELKIQ